MHSMLRGKYGRLCVLVLALITSGVVRAASLEIAPFEKVCESSQCIVEGTVTAASAALEPNGQIWTTYTIATSDTLKSDTGRDIPKLTVKQPGGRVGDVIMHVPMVPHFRIGQEVIVFTRDYGAQWQTVVNGPQGVIALETVSVPLLRPGDASIRTIAHRRPHGAGQYFPELRGLNLDALKQRIRDVVKSQAESAPADAEGE